MRDNLKWLIPLLAAIAIALGILAMRSGKTQSTQIHDGTRATAQSNTPSSSLSASNSAPNPNAGTEPPRTGAAIKGDLLSDLPLVDPKNTDFIRQLAELKNEDAGIVETQRQKVMLDDDETKFMTELITVAHAAQLAFQRSIAKVSKDGNKTKYAIPQHPEEGAKIRDYIIARASKELGWPRELAAEYVALLLPREMQYYGKYDQQIVVEENRVAGKLSGYAIRRSFTSDVGPVSIGSFIGAESVGRDSGEYCLFLP